MAPNPRTVEIRGLTIGDETVYPFALRWITGLGIPTPRTSDLPRGHLDGEYGGDDVLPRRTLVISCACDGREDLILEPDEAVEALMGDLSLAWRPSTVDIPLTVSSGGRTRTFYGRPRGLEFIVDRQCEGVVPTQLTFDAMNPYSVDTPTSVGVTSGSNGFVAAADSPESFNWTLTLTPSASTITVQNTDENEPVLTLTGVSASTVVLDGATRGVTADGVDAPQLIAAGSGWPAVTAGTNTWVITGASGTLGYSPLTL